MNRLTCAFIPALLALTLLACPRPASALATEILGNEPLAESNYKEWPGVFPALNHESRVYGVWVNGTRRSTTPATRRR